MKKIRSWFRRKAPKNDTPSGIEPPLSTEERRENTGSPQLQQGGESGSPQLQHGGDSDSQLQSLTREGEATAKMDEVNPGQVEKDSDSGTGSDVQNPARHQRTPLSISPFMMLDVPTPRIDFDQLRSKYHFVLDQITLVINAKPLLKIDTTKQNPQYWEQTFLTSLSVNGPTSYEYYPLLPSIVDGTVNYTNSSSDIAISQVWTNRSLFMYQFKGSNEYVIMALNLSSVGSFYLLTVDPEAGDTTGPMVSFKQTMDFPSSDSKNGQVFAPYDSKDKTGVHLTTQCSDGMYVLKESKHPSTSNSRFESEYKALSAERYNETLNNGLTLSFITPVFV